MKSRLLQYLVCPDCHSPLSCEPKEVEGVEILSGSLACGACGAAFPIVRGVPRFVRPDRTGEEQQKTAEAFGWEWRHFTELDAPYEEQFLDWIHPVQKSSFRGRRVLDVGCGMGRWTALSASFGASDVVGIDISEAVEVAQGRAAKIPNMHVIQADLHRLPLGRDFDFAYSIGVLHHLPDPEAGFRAMVSHLAPGGAAQAWVYGRENNEWLVRIGNPVREQLSSRMPKPALYGISLAIAAAMHPFLKLLYLSRDKGLEQEKNGGSWLPYHGYLSWLARYSLRHNHHVVFDHLVAPTAHYLRREEFEGWFARAGLKNVQISWRNENSWRGYGEL